SAFLNWIGAGFFGMIISTPTISYYAHGTYLIMPHGHIALLGAFGYISIAFIYMASRTNSLAKGLVWNTKLSNWAFGILTVGALLYAIPTYIIGIEQTRIAHDMGYFYARLRSAVEPMKFWMWMRIIPDGLMLIGGFMVLYDLIQKTYFGKKIGE
ncbi:MAG: cbb3-type cytochrome c oxidase subunit I, partial [Paludibacter sp.]